VQFGALQKSAAFKLNQIFFPLGAEECQFRKFKKKTCVSAPNFFVLIG
jgi:hypothetical protein